LKQIIHFTDRARVLFDESFSEGSGGAGSETGAEAVHWDLRDLYPDVETLDRDLLTCEASAELFTETHRGQLATMSAECFATTMEELEAIQDTAGRAYTFAYLFWSTDTSLADRGALLQKVREVYTRIATHLLFFDLEWAALEDGTVKRLSGRLRTRSIRFFLTKRRMIDCGVTRRGFPPETSLMRSMMKPWRR